MWVHRYTLMPKRALSAIAAPGPRHGALVRIGDGVADVHPWPELGDPPVDEQLARFGATPLTARAIELAKIDGELRRRGRSAFEGLTIPASHWPGADPPAEFDTAKVKGAEHLPDRVRLRLDFNATLTAQEFERIAQRLPRERIDFVEDPCPYDAHVWKSLRQKSGLRLALDRGLASDGVDVLVVKPAVQDFPKTDLEVVVTSYMDHAIGQMAAAWVAASNEGRVGPRCGLFTHVLYEPDPFFERIRSCGPRLLPPEGTGFGFDDLIERLPWKKFS
jgi:o-succinylbenzoate synthase